MRNFGNDLGKLLLLIGVGAAAIGKSNKQSINSLFSSFSQKQVVTTTITGRDENCLTAQECETLQARVKEILANLEIENLKNKSPEEQKRAAYKILRHVIDTASYLYAFSKPHNHIANNKTNSVYQSICEGNIIDSMKSESMAISLLLSECGLNNQRVTIQKHSHKSNAVALEREIVVIDFADGKRLCDPVHTKVAGIHTKNRNDLSGVFMTKDTYFNLYYPYYNITNEQPAITLDSIIHNYTQEQQQNSTIDLGMER